MKRGVLLLIIVLIFLPVVSATLTISGPSQARYNIGDTIDVSGSLQVQDATKGYLQLSLACPEKTFAFPKVAVDLDAVEKVLFSDLSLPTILASSSMKGMCSLHADLLVNGAVVESAVSNSFEITGDLEGTFTVDKTQAQLGDTLLISGNVFQLDGNPVDGSAELYFLYNSEEYLIGFIAVHDGVMNYTHTLSSGAAGKYVLDFVVRDSYGNEQKFSSADSFTLLDQLYVFAQTNEDSYHPGDTMNVFGDVKTILQQPVLTGTVEVSFDGVAQSTALGDSQFTYDILIPSDIKSGEHTIKVSVRDAYGNSGSGMVTITVDPKATVLDVTAGNESLVPEEKINVLATLYDQANDVMVGSISLQVYDTSGQLISQKDVSSEEIVTYQLPKFALPGQWIIKASYQDEFGVVEDQATVNVKEIKKLAYSVINGVVYIRNIGNVRYTDDFQFQVDGEEGTYWIKETENLGVNETIEVDLADELPTGTYEIAVPTGLNSLDLGEVSIDNGTPRSSFNVVYTLLAVLFLGGVSYVGYKRLQPKKQKKQESVAQERPAKKQKTEKKVVPKKPSLTFEDRKVSIEDFKKRTLEEIRKTEEKIKQKEAGKYSPMMNDGKIGYVTGRRDPVQPVDEPNEKQEKSVFSLFDDE